MEPSRHAGRHRGAGDRLRLINPNFWSATNLANVSRQMSILALLSIGQTFAILSGGIDLSVGSLLALVSVVCAQQMKASAWSRA